MDELILFASVTIACAVLLLIIIVYMIRRRGKDFTGSGTPDKPIAGETLAASFGSLQWKWMKKHWVAEVAISILALVFFFYRLPSSPSPNLDWGIIGVAIGTLYIMGQYMRISFITEHPRYQMAKKGGYEREYRIIWYALSAFIILIGFLMIFWNM